MIVLTAVTSYQTAVDSIVGMLIFFLVWILELASWEVMSLGRVEVLWFQKNSLDTLGFRTGGMGSRVLNQKVTFGVLNVPGGWGHWFRTKS